MVIPSALGAEDSRFESERSDIFIINGVLQCTKHLSRKKFS